MPAKTSASITTMQLVIWVVTFIAMLALTLFIRYPAWDAPPPRLRGRFEDGKPARDQH